VDPCGSVWIRRLGMSLMCRLDDVAKFRVEYASTHDCYPWAHVSESVDGYVRDLLTLEEAMTLRDVYGYPNAVVVGLVGGLGKPAHYSAVAMVAGCGDVKAAKYLISRGLDFEAEDDLKLTPIELAARLGKAHMVRFLHHAAPIPADDFGLDNLLSDVVEMVESASASASASASGKGGAREKQGIATIRELCKAYCDDCDGVRLCSSALHAGLFVVFDIMHVTK
jgi:hypothetical protein